MTASADNITWHEHSVSNEERSLLNGHGSALIWFTGLSGAGKSTIANAVDFKLHQRRVHSYLLDGDNVRHGLNRNLGFSEPDRIENIRRIGEVGKLLVDAGLIVCSAFISPYRGDRESIRDLLPVGQFIEVFVKASLETCELRDPKGLYKKARAGEIANFTGIDAPYEIPDKPEIVLDSDLFNVEQLADEVLKLLSAKGLVSN
ncbi:MAG: adenylylsulfate kinase [Gammaproteobacteria bacterium]|jgi:adenylylsulfate kinase